MKNRHLKFFSLILFLMFFNRTVCIKAQQLMLPLGEDYKQIIGFELNKQTNTINTGFKPLLKSDLASYLRIDSILYNEAYEEAFYMNHKRNLLWRKLIFEDFIKVEKGSFSLYVNPLFYLEYGKTSDSTSYFINTRGIEIKGDIGKKLSFFSSFRENQARFRPYIYNWSWDRLVVPGQGAFKKNNNDPGKFDFSGASAYLSYSPFSWFNIQIGQDKNFIGEGHRSLFLSDNSFNYPFSKFSFSYKNLKYVSMFTQFRDFEDVYYNYHFKKYGAFNYLSYNFKNRAEIGLFEGAIYRTTDTTAYYNKFKADYFIPIIGIKTASTGFNSVHNLLIGVNTKIKLSKHIQAYGQFALDDPSQKKYAYQGGIKIFDAFHSKLYRQRLYIQGEYNLATARTYSHSDIKFQTWSHYNQELAHPAGSDFSEIYLNMCYLVFNFKLVYNYQNLTYNKSSSYSDIFITDNENYLAFLDQKIIDSHTFTGSYIINKKTNLEAYFGYNIRSSTGLENAKEKYFFIGLKTALSNFYYDF